MTDHSDLIDRLRAACVGYPRASIAWPHRLLHEAADALSSQSLSLSEARAENDRKDVEIERLKKERDEFATLQREALQFWDAERAQVTEWYEKYEAAETPLKTFVAHYPMGTNPFLDDAFRRARSVLENGPAVLADATSNPPLSDLSSLRKGAEVSALDWHRVSYGWLAFEEWYRIEDNGPNWPTERYWLYERGERLGKFDTLANAQATMQARHETRIRSALVSGSREDGA